MAKQNEPSKNNEPLDFNQFMFGRPANDKQPTSQPKAEEDESFDIFDTTSTLFETYRQLSPYFEHITNIIKKMK
ncbi:hypothetical protein [Pontibacillus marinus]|uniref:Uncharacterized protein n=1 Tax=Pontibacillus marinus BH030004 = DSM 16465 TaxID=1385511 RepID=A0A0A5G218_9BACI|nr:hypothetical protein [Pontibacillus marinus]KGX86064.1 hypothetical protein N783_12805 [Pontibacillus marinus BH030004 = DSM 16465]